MKSKESREDCNHNIRRPGISTTGKAGLKIIHTNADGLVVNSKGLQFRNCISKIISGIETKL